MPSFKSTKRPPAPAVTPARTPWTAGPRLVYLPSPHALLTRADLAEIFAKLGTDSLVTRGLRQIVQERTVAAMTDVASTRVSDTDRAHAAGRLEELLGLQDEIIALTQPAQRAKSA